MIPMGTPDIGDGHAAAGLLPSPAETTTAPVNHPPDVPAIAGKETGASVQTPDDAPTGAVAAIEVGAVAGVAFQPDTGTMPGHCERNTGAIADGSPPGNGTTPRRTHYSMRS